VLGDSLPGTHVSSLSGILNQSILAPGCGIGVHVTAGFGGRFLQWAIELCILRLASAENGFTQDIILVLGAEVNGVICDVLVG
jgi:hypothetical protein